MSYNGFTPKREGVVSGDRTHRGGFGGMCNGG